MGKRNDFLLALNTLGDGRYHYYDGRPDGIGCSEYTRRALIDANIIKSNESFHAASAYEGVLADTTRFQRIPWSPNNLQAADIMWSAGHHVATWDGYNGLFEAAPEWSHGICDNGKTGVGHWSKHTYYNCGTGTKTWSCLFRIIEPEEIKTIAKGIIEMDTTFNFSVLAEYLPVIKYGSKGDFVEALQKILQHYGWYSADIDGHAGNATVAGIKLLQTAVGVGTDGICGPKTWGKVFA